MPALSLPRVRKGALLSLVIAAPALLAACTPGHAQSTFGPAGPVAQDQKTLYIVIFWVAAAVFIVVELALVFSVVHFRRRRTPDELPGQTHGNQGLEIAWTLVPVALLLIIAVPTVKLVFGQSQGPEGSVPDAYREIRVIGHQWWWEVEYVGEDVVTANEVHIPAGVPVKFTLESADVIHSFWVPKLGGKMDLVPNKTNTLWLEADEPGDYSGQCGEFCGVGHAEMRFRVVAESAADFQAWLEAMRRPPADPAPGSPAAAGRTLFVANCSMCHSTDTWNTAAARAEPQRQRDRQALFVADPEGARVIAAPDLTHLATRRMLGAGLTALNEENLKRWITDPDAIKKGNRMKLLAAVYDGGHVKLSAEEVSQLAAYLMSLRPVSADVEARSAETSAGPDPAARGAALFAERGCAGCHSTGSDTLVGPGLGGLSRRAAGRVPGEDAETYVRESIKDPAAFVVEGFQPLMPATFAATLSGDEIDALTAYLLALP